MIYTVELSPELATAVAAAALWRGMSPDQYMLEAVARASRLDAQLAAEIQLGADDLAAGRSYSQEEVETIFDVHREQRRAA